MNYLVQVLVYRACWFQAEPLPEGVWAVTVKSEQESWLQGIKAWGRGQTGSDDSPMT